MKRDDHNAGGLSALGRVLDAFGADAARWPSAVRARLKRLVAEEPAARQRLAESRALDRLLDLAPRRSAESERALTDRIVAAAVSAPSGSGARGRIIPFPQVQRPARVPVRTPARAVWQTAALLAACLMAGLYIGEMRSLNPVLQEFADQIGINADFDQTALADDGLDEDAL